VFEHLLTGELCPPLLPDKTLVSNWRMRDALHQELTSAGEIKFTGPKSNGLWTSMQPLILK
jgi:hypothetical protein